MVNQSNGRHRFTAPLVAALLAAALAAPPAAAQRKTNASAKDSTASLVWPLPPETPRVKYLTTYQSVKDFNQKKPSRWKALLLGPDPAAYADRMVKPYGVSVGGGHVYVTDTAARKVFVFDPGARTVGFVGESGQGKIVKPIGVAADEGGRVFVVDATLKRIFGYGPDGNLAIAIGRDGEFENPAGLALDRTRHLLYVADAGKHQILCYSAEDGRAIRTIGKRGTAPGEFNFPTNLYVDRQNRLYVADTLNFRVQVFDPDGKPVRSIGTQGDSAGNLNRPKGVAVDSEGHVYVADTSFNNFQIFDDHGRILLFVGTSGRGPGEFLLPAGLYIDDQDRIYVADQGNGRVQVFQYLGGRRH